MTGSLRASDADRDQVAELLHRAYVEGRLTREEHDERTDAALAARTFDDLSALTADLVPAGSQIVPAAGPNSSSIVVSDGAETEPDKMTAVMSSVKRIGPWRVRRTSSVQSFLGTVVLDMTEATFDAPVVEVNATSFMGEVLIRVPAGVAVRDEVANVLGDTTIKDLTPVDPTMPTVVVRGTNVFSEIKVRGPKKPSRWRKALA